jgi:hypothetical protein
VEHLKGSLRDPLRDQMTNHGFRVRHRQRLVLLVSCLCWVLVLFLLSIITNSV